MRLAVSRMPDDLTAGAPSPRRAAPGAPPSSHPTTGPTCPSCGATLIGEGDTAVPGLTAIDADAILRNARAGDKPKSRGRLLAGSAATTRRRGRRGAAPGSLSPPPVEVRREMLRLELEAQVANAQAEVEAMAADAAIESGTPLRVGRGDGRGRPTSPTGIEPGAGGRAGPAGGRARPRRRSTGEVDAAYAVRRRSPTPSSTPADDAAAADDRRAGRDAARLTRGLRPRRSPPSLLAEPSSTGTLRRCPIACPRPARPSCASTPSRRTAGAPAAGHEPARPRPTTAGGSRSPGSPTTTASSRSSISRRPPVPDPSRRWRCSGRPSPEP